MAAADLVIRNCGEVVTAVGSTACRGNDMRRLQRWENVAILARDGAIVAIGPEAEILPQTRRARVELDAGHCTVLPGFVDPHTHAVFGTPRAAEYAARLEGRSYIEIAAAGGGIHQSVREVRAASEDELVAWAEPRLQRMLEHGTTTVEIKSGYGLDTDNELKMLRAIRRLAAGAPQEVIATFLGAHELPLEFRSRRAAYLAQVRDEMLPAASRWAEFNDVFCEPSVFTLDESEAILRAGMAHGLQPKLHADELEPYGAAELACRLGAVSADHLMHVSETGIRALGAAATVAVLLPATTIGLGRNEFAPARRLVEQGAAVAVASDFNPGSSHCENMQAVWSLACSMLRLTPAEGLVAVTLNAAAALGRASRTGSLETGKRCDLLVMRGRDWREVPFHFGVNNVRHVVCGGRVVWTDPDVQDAVREAREA